MNYKIRFIEEKELTETLELVKRVFDEFEAPYYSKEGIENFYRFANYKNIKEMLKNNLKILVVKDKEKIIGMLAFRDLKHISMLFVNKNYNKQGIARTLVEETREYCKVNNKELISITANSSPYAVEFYKKIGFRKIEDEKTVDGIKFTPMKLYLYNLCEYKDEYLDILYKMKKEQFMWYVEKIYGWDEKIQIKFFEDFIQQHRKDIKVIKIEQKIIGLFTNYINEKNETVIDLFYIDTEYQGKGIGTEILEEQLKLDKEKKRNTMLQVFKENKARFLYKKVGFEIYEETETHYKMIRKI